MIKGLIFDLDGTLTLTQQFHYMALREVFKSYGVKYTQKEDQEKYSGKRSTDICREVLTGAGKSSTQEIIEQCAARKKEVYDKIIAKEEIKPVPGVREFLDRAKKAGLKMIVATGNKLDATKTILGRVGLAEYFDQIVSQADVKHQKPAPDLFLLAAEKMGLGPSQCIVFEDAPNGVKAARAGGILCGGLTTGTTAAVLQKAGANFTILDYNELIIKISENLDLHL